MWVFIYTLLGVFVMTHCHQRVAPGVPPQNYVPNQPGVPAHHHPPPVQQQQMHQVPVHQQQVPVHQQQVPIQQQVPMHQQQHVPQMQQMPLQQVPQQHMQQQQQQHIPQHHQQVPMQQIPVQQGHQAHHPQQILNAANMAHEKEHIQEHMDIPMDTSKMSEQELQFHYFKMHDADNNNKLDGCELIKSLIHWHEQGHQDPNSPTPTGEKVFKDEELVQLIDPILGMDDGNNDGFIDYPEFVQAQQKASATAGQQQQPPHQ